MTHNETYYKEKLKKRLEERDALVFRHEDRFTGSIPDMSVHYDSVTSWWEVKVDDRELKHGQWITLYRLNCRRICAYELRIFTGIERVTISRANPRHSLDFLSKDLKLMYENDYNSEELINTILFASKLLGIK